MISRRSFVTSLGYLGATATLSSRNTFVTARRLFGLALPKKQSH